MFRESMSFITAFSAAEINGLLKVCKCHDSVILFCILPVTYLNGIATFNTVMNVILS